MKVFILGAGGLARETYYHITDIDPKAEILFIDDFTSTTEISLRGKTIKVLKTWSDVEKLIPEGFETFTVGVGDPVAKKNFVGKAVAAGLKGHSTWIHPKAWVQDAKIGVGGLIAPGVMITCNVTVGDYVVLNLNSTVGHDAVIGDYSTCNPGSAISGNVIIGEQCLVGVGAIVREKLSIANNVVVGAQSCVVKDVDEVGVVAGVPAKKLK